MIGHFGGMEIIQVDAQQQMRTPKNVKVRWVRPRVPSKLSGRKGTRKGWKRKNPPHWLMAYREPDDLLVIQDRTIIATPRQYIALRQSIPPRRAETSFGLGAEQWWRGSAGHRPITVANPSPHQVLQQAKPL